MSQAHLLPLLPFPFDKVKQCHESEDKVAQMNVVVQHQLMIDRRVRTSQFVSHILCILCARRAAQTVHPLGVHSSRNSRDCTNRDRAAISSRLCGLKLVYLTLSSPQLSYLVHFIRLTQTAAVEVISL